MNIFATFFADFPIILLILYAKRLRMELFLARLILGGTFFLLIISGIALVCLKDGLVQSPKMHRYLGVSVLLSACLVFCQYLESLVPDYAFHYVVETIVALVALLVYIFLGYKIIYLIIGRCKIVPTEVQQESHTEAVATIAEENIAEADETESEAADEDDNDATDENGNPVPEPSVNNMDDLIFFQRLEAVMMKKRLFSEQDITREQIAAEVGTNRTYLIRSIKLATGMTFNEYITNLRVNYAATLLTSSDEPLEYIGTIAGFRSKSAYYRAFAAANHCTPAEYRNRNK